MSKKEQFLLIAKIADRAKANDLLFHDKMSFIMDMESAVDRFNLDLNGLLQADDNNFYHDVLGIQAHIIRSTSPATFTDCYEPRFARC